MVNKLNLTFNQKIVLLLIFLKGAIVLFYQNSNMFKVLLKSTLAPYNFTAGYYIIL